MDSVSTIARVAGITFSRTNLITLRTYWIGTALRLTLRGKNVSAWVGPKSATTTAIEMEDFVEGIIDESATSCPQWQHPM